MNILETRVKLTWISPEGKLLTILYFSSVESANHWTRQKIGTFIFDAVPYRTERQREEYQA
jgi:hypothetical protein